MQTGSISFCDSVALNIKSEHVKKEILEKIQSKYAIKIIQKHFERYTEDSLLKIKRNPHLMYIKSNGNPYFMFLTCINNVNTCLLVDKKIQHGYFYPRMIIVNMLFGDELFSDTIFDGEMTKNNDGNWVYLINDLLIFKGTMLSNMNIIKRINLVHKTLISQYEPDCSIFAIQVKKYFRCSEIEDLYAFKSSTNHTSRGIVFTPLFLKFKNILLNFDSTLVKSTHRFKLSNTNEFIDRPIQSQNTPDGPRVSTHDQKITSKFKIKYTGQPDMYELYDNNKSLGHACVNSMSTSKMLADKFMNKTLQAVYDAECLYSSKFNKWIPIRLF